MKLLWLFIFVSSQALGQGLYYLQETQVDLSTISPPPVQGSSEELAEVAVLEFLQSTRTSADCERAQAEADGLATSFFGPPYGPLTSLEAQALVDFQERMFDEVNYFTRKLKTKFQRARPFVAYPQITPCVQVHNSLAYPSGHAATGYLSARAFAVIFPEFESLLIERGWTVGHDRALGGVHYPSDVRAGQELAEKVWSLLKVHPQFLADLKVLRAKLYE